MPITKNSVQENKNAGFTLVELVVVFVIMVMLASLSVVGVLAYQDYADYKRQNSYAQTLFVAAQTKLTGYSVRGQKELIQKVATNPLQLSEVITPIGVAATESERGINAKTGDVYYLMGTRDTYEKYLAGEYRNRTDSDSVAYQALYDLFDEFLMEKSILKACISIEFNPEKCLVYSVIYSDKCGSFTYTKANKTGRVNILNRQEDYRSENMIGYYGLD